MYRHFVWGLAADPVLQVDYVAMHCAVQAFWLGIAAYAIPTRKCDICGQGKGYQNKDMLVGMRLLKLKMHVMQPFWQPDCCIRH